MAFTIVYFREYSNPIQHPYPFGPEFYLEAGQGFINKTARSSNWNSPYLTLTESVNQGISKTYFQNRYQQTQGFETKYWSQSVDYDQSSGMIQIHSMFVDIGVSTKDYWIFIPLGFGFWTSVKVADFSSIDPSPAPETILVWNSIPNFQSITGWPVGSSALFAWLKFEGAGALALRTPDIYNPLKTVSNGKRRGVEFLSSIS